MSIKRNRSIIKILKKSGPKMDPCVEIHKYDKTY